MIIVIDALNRDEYSGLLDQMFRLRAEVFGERLGWDVKITDGREIDEFDALDPAYVIGLDEEGHVVACVRALQTTGPHMLADVFSAILDGEPPLRSARLWESTRFCVDTRRLGKSDSKLSVSHATCELMIGALEYAQASGISDIITVIDPIMNRVLKRSDNAPYDYVGITAPMGKVSAMAALLDCTDERINRVRAFAGIFDDVFATPEQLEALMDQPEKSLAALTAEDMAEYLRDQLATCESDEERMAALALCLELADSDEFRSTTEAWKLALQ